MVALTNSRVMRGQLLLLHREFLVKPGNAMTCRLSFFTDWELWSNTQQKQRDTLISNSAVSDDSAPFSCTQFPYYPERL